jgi:hypothetical protein
MGQIAIEGHAIPARQCLIGMTAISAFTPENFARHIDATDIGIRLYTVGYLNDVAGHTRTWSKDLWNVLCKVR